MLRESAEFRFVKIKHPWYLIWPPFYHLTLNQVKITYKGNSSLIQTFSHKMLFCSSKHFQIFFKNVKFSKIIFLKSSHWSLHMGYNFFALEENIRHYQQWVSSRLCCQAWGSWWGPWARLVWAHSLSPVQQSCASRACCHYLSPTMNIAVDASKGKPVSGLNLQREKHIKSLESIEEKR